MIIIKKEEEDIKSDRMSINRMIKVATEELNVKVKTNHKTINQIEEAKEEIKNKTNTRRTIKEDSNEEVIIRSTKMTNKPVEIGEDTRRNIKATMRGIGKIVADMEEDKEETRVIVAIDKIIEGAMTHNISQSNGKEEKKEIRMSQKDSNKRNSKPKEAARKMSIVNKRLRKEIKDGTKIPDKEVIESTTMKEEKEEVAVEVEDIKRIMRMMVKEDKVGATKKKTMTTKKGTMEEARDSKGIARPKNSFLKARTSLNWDDQIKLIHSNV